MEFSTEAFQSTCHKKESFLKYLYENDFFVDNLANRIHKYFFIFDLLNKMRTKQTFNDEEVNVSETLWFLLSMHTFRNLIKIKKKIIPYHIKQNSLSTI